MIEFTYDYDWYEINRNTICLSIGNDAKAVIKKNGNKYYLFQVFHFGGQSGELNFVSSSADISDLIEQVHNKIKYRNSYVMVDADWKFETPTEKQLQYCWGAENKWQVHIHFSKYIIGKLFKNYVHFDTDEGEVVF